MKSHYSNDYYLAKWTANIQTTYLYIQMNNYYSNDYYLAKRTAFIPTTTI